MADRRPCRSVSWPAVSVKLEQGVPHADDVTRGPRQRQLRFRPTVCKTLVEAAAVTSVGEHNGGQRVRGAFSGEYSTGANQSAALPLGNGRRWVRDILGRRARRVQQESCKPPSVRDLFGRAPREIRRRTRTMIETEATTAQSIFWTQVRTRLL
jgi:hypothetical protein